MFYGFWILEFLALFYCSLARTWLRMASETIRFMILLFCKILEANCSDRAYLNKMVQNLNFLNFVPSMQPDLALNLKSSTECVTKCLQIQTCHIVFYKNDFHQCNLYITTTYKTIFQNLIQDSGWKSYYHDQSKSCFIFSLSKRTICSSHAGADQTL